MLETTPEIRTKCKQKAFVAQCQLKSCCWESLFKNALNISLSEWFHQWR